MSSDFKIDINADVGEGLNNEHLLMPYLSSCNIACGGHAGDADTMSNVVRLAKKYNVKVGAHPSFPDKPNFGRKIMEISPEDLSVSINMQIEALLEVLNSENLVINHIKPHGALYNLVAKDEKTARIVLDVIKSIPEDLKLYAPYKSVISQLARQEDIEVVFEGFADRNYNKDLSLIPRQNSNAIFTDKEVVYNHVLRMILDKKVRCVSGEEVAFYTDTICVHGDTKNAQELLRFLCVKLKEHNIQIA